MYKIKENEYIDLSYVVYIKTGNYSNAGNTYHVIVITIAVPQKDDIIIRFVTEQERDEAFLNLAAALNSRADRPSREG